MAVAKPQQQVGATTNNQRVAETWGFVFVEIDVSERKNDLVLKDTNRAPAPLPTCLRASLVLSYRTSSHIPYSSKKIAPSFHSCATYNQPHLALQPLKLKPNVRDAFLSEPFLVSNTPTHAYEGTPYRLPRRLPEMVSLLVVCYVGCP